MTRELFFYEIGNFFPETAKNIELVLNPFNLIDFTMLKKLLLFATLFIIVSSTCISGVFSADEIEILGPKIHAGTGIRPRCGNNVTSCGDPGSCVDLTGKVYCVRGRVVETRCLSNNVKNETLTSSCNGGDYRLSVSKSDGSGNSVNTTLYSAGSSRIIGKSSIVGEGVINSLESDADMEFDLRGEFNFLIKGVNLEILKTNHNFLIDKINATISGTTVFKTFYVELPQGFTFSTIVLKIKYNDVPISENNITLYKCSNFSASGICNGNWQKIPVIKDSAKKIVIAEVNSFSAYALGDLGTDTTTTTTTTTTTVPNSTTTTTTVATTTSTTTIYYDSGSGSDYSDYESEPQTTTSIEETMIETETTDNTTLVNETNQTAQQNSTNPITAFISMPNNYAFIISAAAVGVGGLIFRMVKQDSNFKTKYYPGAVKFKKMKKPAKKASKDPDFVLRL